MTTNLQVRFTGSCAFVPHPDGKAVRVLLPEASRGWDAQHPAGHGLKVPPHRAYLRFPMENLKPGSRQPEIIYWDDEIKAYSGICILNQEVVQLPPISGRLAYSLKQLPVTTWPQPPDPNRDDLFWVPQMKKICLRASVDPGYLQNNLSDLAAALDLTAGTLATDFCRIGGGTFDPTLEQGSVCSQDFASGRYDSTRMFRRRRAIKGKYRTVFSYPAASLRFLARDRKRGNQ